MKMTKRLLAAVAVFVVGTGLTFGQKEAKDAIHLMGTVTKLAGDTATVSTPDNSTSADVVLQPTTTYKVGVKPATRADLAVGDTVNVVVVRKNPNWLAQSVKITRPKPAK
jgi:hypothetical protein